MRLKQNAREKHNFQNKIHPFFIFIFQASCVAVKSYIDDTLGPYLVNVTSAAVLCSQTMCSSQGRCQRKDLKTRSYLHLDPAEWKVVSEQKPGGGRNYQVVAQTGTQKVQPTKSEFRCRCYPGWGGEDCSKRR